MNSTEIRNKRRAKGLCPYCGKSSETASKMCNACKEIWGKRQKSLRAKSLAEGKCRDCHNPRDGTSLRYCVKCQENRKKYRAKYRTKYNYFKYLARNLFGDLSKSESLRLNFEKNPFCRYSGRELKIGENVSLDHIVAKSKGGSNQETNLQWVDRTVNVMKQNMDEDDFLALIKDIYEHSVLKRSSPSCN